MKLENFTTNFKVRVGKLSNLMLFSMLLTFTFNQAAAQCPLGCNNSVQISLDTDCSVEVTPEMILEGQGTTGCDYEVSVLGSNGQPIPGSPFVTGAYIGQTLRVRVSLDANSCWGNITIEDKLPPQIDCPDDLTVDCYETPNIGLPSATDNCDNFVSVLTLSDDIVDLDCTQNFSAQRTIVYQAVDDSGNESAICTRNIFFERITLGEIVFPRDKDDVEDDALECDNTPLWDLNGNGYPEPEETGTPETADGFNIFPNNSYCELNATFTDQRLDICESSFKVLRTWTVLDWCTGEIREDFQIIKVIDNAKPIVTAVPDTDPLTTGLSADPYTCTHDWLVPPPIVIFDCSSTSYTVSYLLADDNGDPPMNGVYINTNVVENGDGTYTILDLPLGRTWIRYTVTDACGNVEFAFTEADVVDDVPPVPVCDEFTAATLTTNGYAHIFATSFDDGSHDNCSDVDFDVRRMTPGCGASTTVFGEYAEFCCSDVGEETMVVLRVTDESGNSNTCMVIVHVQDKLDPVITCPDDITLDCGEDPFDEALVGTATATDNCGPVDITLNTSGSLNDCGEGRIFRRFTATDAGGRTDVCTQVVEVENDNPFNGNTINWPRDVDRDGCARDFDLDPSITGRPLYNDDACALVAETYEDQLFSFVDSVCIKILRTWTVIDWCQFDQNNPNQGGIWQYTQVIKVNNSEEPVFAVCEDITVDAINADCTGFADLAVEATDDCTPNEDLDYEYEIDFFSDGTLDDFGNSNDASANYPVGVHTITYRAEDMCGNVGRCTFTYTVIDTKKPTPYCLSEITTVIMPTTGEIDIWAWDYDLGSTDNCPGDLLFSFSSNTNNTSAFFDCDDLGMNDLEIWVTDASGNQDFCTVTINIQSNDACDGSRIAGSVSTYTGEMLEDAEVSLQDMSSSESMLFDTETSGEFSFQPLTNGHDYEISVKKDGDDLNGVSTIDIVMIQRHILGLEFFDSPYKVIAADINNDERLRASDLIALRKLILGVDTELKNNDSWRFVDADQSFNDMFDPFPFTEKMYQMNIQTTSMGNDFVAVKIGDVNNSAATSNLKGDDETTVRSNHKLNFAIADAAVEAGDLVEIPVYAGNTKAIYGFQFTLNTNGLDVEFVEAGKLAVEESMIGYFNNAVTMSYANPQGIEISEGDVLFTITARARTNSDVAKELELSSKITKAEAYTTNLDIADMTIEFRGKSIEETTGFEVLQNTPNPFSGVTTISFITPNAGQASLKVFDVSGKVLHSAMGNVVKGNNSFQIDEAAVQAKGVLYYQIEFEGAVVTKKMISM